MPLTIVHTEPSGGLGGQEFRTLAEARGMASRGHRVILALRPDSALRPLAEQAGLLVEPLVFARSRFGPLVVECFRLISRHAPDIVNTHGSIDSWTASIAARLSPVHPVIVRTRHKVTPVSRSPLNRLLYRVLPHGIITTGVAVREYLMERFRLDADRIVSIPSGVDLRVFQAGAGSGVLRKELGIQPAQPLIGVVSFLRAAKGIREFVAAAALVSRAYPDARFVIAGDGHERAGLVRQIEESGLTGTCFMIGHRNDVPQVLAELDIFVLPTLDDAMPQSLTQAMAMKRPVVATAVGGIPEVIRDGVTGLLVPPGDPVSLARAIERFVGDPGLRHTVAEEGYRLIQERYTFEQMLDVTESFYQHLRACS
ncbi:glycosyltransferase [Nitrospira sp. NS4]|uniref:glycosyltransferase n=1 Tax=Nitrospira sp. NS4 TaxID=3414498 RepID=UPI003C2E88A2